MKRTEIHLFVVLLFFVSFGGCSDSGVPAAPQAHSADQIAAAIRALPKYVHFSLSGVAFFKGKVYLSSNIGLLVISGAKPETLYKWVARDDVVEGPWNDTSNDALWIQHAHDNSLSRLDGTAWHRVALPVPPGGYTRGDILGGFLGVSAPTAFWLVGGGHVWRFHAEDTSWVSEKEPPAPQYSAIRAVAPFGSSMLYIVREGLEITPPSKYGVYDRENNWTRQNISEQMDFGGIVANAEGVYLRAKEGNVFLIRSENVQILEVPGRCEAITRTTTGKLLASFVNQGIFLFDNRKWDLQVPYPYGKDEAEHWAYLAESNGQIAYATTSVSGSNALWVQRASKLERIPFA